MEGVAEMATVTMRMLILMKVLPPGVMGGLWLAYCALPAENTLLCSLASPVEAHTPPHTHAGAEPHGEGRKGRRVFEGNH